MRQGLVNGDAFTGVQHEGGIQEVLQLPHFLKLVFREALVPDQLCKQVLAGTDGAQNGNFLLQNTCP